MKKVKLVKDAFREDGSDDDDFDLFGDNNDKENIGEALNIFSKISSTKEKTKVQTDSEDLFSDSGDADDL